MQARTSRIILVTGASSGIGREAAALLAAAGHRVYAASRRPQTGAPAGAIPLVLDVDSDDSVDAAVRQVLEDAGRIDVLIQCAGFGIAGAVEDTPLPEVRAQFETNFFGAVRVTRAVLPAMRGQGGGLIVNVGSLVTRIPVPFQAFYCASKAALHSYSEGLRLELAPLGIRVAVLEPGNFRTDFTARRRRVAGWTAESPYHARSERSVGWMERDERNGPDPALAARRLRRIVEMRNPALYHLAVSPVERLGASLRQLLPWHWYERLALRIFRAG